MDFVTALTTFIKAHPYVAYPVLFAGAYFEILVPFAFFIPGEIFFYAAGILGAAGFLDIWIAGIVLIIGGMCGDATSFYIGRHYAADIERYVRRVRFTANIYERGKNFVERHGDWSILLSRFFGPASWVTPFLAGASGMRVRRFALLEPLPAIVAIGINVGIGYGVGLGYQYLETFLHQYALVVGVAIVGLAIGVPYFSRYRTRRLRELKDADAKQRSK